MKYIAALSDGGLVSQLFSADDAAIAAFAKSCDGPGKVVAQCVSELKDGASSRSLETVRRLWFLHVDVDVRALEQTKEQVLPVLNELPLSFGINDSGRGYHLMARLKEPVEIGTPDYERACRFRSALTRVLCGDPANDHSAALLRVVGTHNYKCDPPVECHVVEAGAPVSLDDIQAFLEMYPTPLFARKDGADPRPEKRHATGETENGFDSSLGELNSAALKHLKLWVPDLDLFGCKRRKGKYDSYDAVPDFRPSSTVRPLEQRGLNLRIVGSGIRDFGTAKGYSPLDLVMAKRGCSVYEAARWLEERVPVNRPDADIDIDACIEAQDAPPLAPENGEQDDNVRVYGRIRLTPYDAIPPEKLKRRLWLYRRHYLGGTVSSTVGDSGIGKTSLSLIEIVGLSVGRDLLGDEKIRAHRCWYHNGEDTRDEINLRLGAICEYYQLDQNEVRKNLTITCGLDMPVEVAAGSPPVIDKKLVQDIADAITGEGFEVAVFDPLITMHQVNENGIEIRTVLRNVFARVANFTGCAIELPHHTRKLFPGVEEASADDARGSTEIKAAVRGMRMASLMTKAEAELFQISETDRLSYFKTFSAKANMAKRGNVFWYKIESHDLPNGVPEENIPGEAVGVVTRWNPPTALDPLTLYTLDDKKYWYEAAGNDEHRYDQRSPVWFGHIIAERLKLKARTNPEHKRQAAAVLEALIEEGVLTLQSATTENGRKAMWVVAGVPTWEDNQCGK